MGQSIKTPSGRVFASAESLNAQLKGDILRACNVQGVKVEDIRDDDILINGDGALNLDSLDAVEIAVLVDRLYGIKIKDLSSAKIAMKSIASLSDHIWTHSEPLNE